MIRKVTNTINKYNMLSYGDKVIVGVSGGADSISLLHVLYSLKDEYNIKIIVVHVNHSLRGIESDGDEEYVKAICEKLDIKLYTKRIDIEKISKDNKISIEVAGRECRYNFLDKILIKENAQKIVIAHNQNDTVETILMRIIRGTGIEGITGIKPVRDNIIRPLIETSREEIDKFCIENNIIPRTDSSNLKNIYTRNKIRLELIPYIKKEFNPNIINTLSRMGHLIENDNKYIDNEAKIIFSEVVLEKKNEYISIDLDKISKHTYLIFGRVIRTCIKELIGELVDFEQKNIEDSLCFIENSKTGSIYDLPKGLRLKKEYNILYITKNNIKIEEKVYSYDINVPSTIHIIETGGTIISKLQKIEDCNLDTSKYTVIFDADKINGQLSIRNRAPGDIIYPNGMKGKKKLKDYFIDQKIPREERHLIPLISIDNQIIWIIGRRISNNYKIDNKTKNVLSLTYQIKI